MVALYTITLTGSEIGNEAQKETIGHPYGYGNIITRSISKFRF